MKKFLTFLALCCLMVTGAWAQYNVTVGAPVDISSLAAGSQTDVLMYAGGDGNYGFVHTPTSTGRFTIDTGFNGTSAIVDNAYFFKLIKNDDGTVSVKNYAGNYIPGYSNSSNGDYGPGAAGNAAWTINFTVETNTSTTNVREGGFAYTLTANRENGLPVEKNGDHFGIKKDNQYIIPLQFCTYTCTALPVADALKGNFINVASDAATTIEEGWYMLNNKNRNNYVADNYTAFKMVGSKPSGNQQAYSYAGRLFYIAPSATEGKWNISSGYGHYVSLGNNSSAITTDKHDFTIELIAVDGNTDVFYFKDDNTGYVANGQQTNNNFVGWETNAPTELSGNSQYRFYKAEVISLPVKTVATVNDLDDATWYQLTVRNKYVKYDAASGTYYDTYDSRPAEDDYTSLFAFVGDDPSGYKIVNYSAGFDKAMGADNANTDTRLKSVDFDAARSYYFKPVTISGNPGWQIYDKATPAAYLNHQSTNMGYWQGGGNGDLGNAFTFTEVEVVPVTPDPVEEANTLTPASGETVESSDLANISVNFTGENAEIIWYDETAKATLTKVDSDPVESIEGTIAHGEYGNPFSVTFDTSAITGGTWRLNIPEGTFYIVNISTANTPIKAITATYTVAAVPTAGKVYTIKAHFNSEELDDIYLSNDGTSMTFPTAASVTQSYWVAVANDGSDAETCPWKFQSGYGDGKYLNVNGVNTTASIFGVRACDNQEDAGCYHLYNKAQDRNIGTFALNQSKNGWGSFGSGGCWSTGHNNGGNPAWTTDYIIEEVKNVDVYTVSGMGSVGVTGISDYTYASAVAAGGVLIVPAGTTLTDANFTNDANTLVVVDATAKTITLTEVIVTKPTSLDQIEQGVPYTITTYDRGAMIYTENGLSSTTNVGVDIDSSDPDQQFLFVEYHGQYYFYSVGGDKFINVTGLNQENNRAVGVDAPVNTSLTFEASTGSRKADFPVVLNIDNRHVGISNSFVPAVITHYKGTADDGNMVRLTPVLGTTVDLDPIIAKFPKICPIDAATYYVTIENHETGRQPFLFNDVQYADEITLQGASHDTSKNGYIWKVTSDGEGNITDIVNAETGKGIKPSGGKASSSITEFQYTAGTNAGYYNLINSTAITGDHDRLNASNGSPYVNEVGLRAVTTWNGAHNDNEWKFNAVDTEDLVEYNVVVSPAESRGYALYDGKKAGNGGFFLAPEGLTQSDFAGGELRGFICDGVTLTDHTITLTYTAATPVQVNYTLYLKEGDTETLLETAAEAVSEYVGQAPQHPFTVPDYVDVTYDQGVDENGLIDGTATAIKVVTAYNDLMPFTPGELTTVDIDIRNHYYFHVEERTITIDGESKKLWLPCISPKAPTFDDDAAYIWRMEGDWYHGFRFHNDQLAKEGEGDGTACHITYKHKEVMSETMEQMEGMKGATSLTEKTYTLESTTDLSIASRATLTGDADDRNSYFELVHATGNIQHYNGEPAEWQFRLMDHKNLYLNFRDYSAVGDNPDSLLCLYGGGYGDNASSFTFHKNEVCTEDDRQAVLAMIDAIEKGAVGALIDKDAQEYQDLLTLKGRIEDTTIGCTRALFDVYTEKLVKYAGEKKTPADGEAYRLAVRTKEGRNFYLKDDGTYTTDSLDAAIYVLGSSADGTKKILAGNNNEDLYYFRNGGLTKASYAEGDCDFNYELMAGKETVADVLDATGAAKYATVCLTDGNGKVATMTSPDKATATGTCTWEEPQDVVYMNDELSSAIVMEPVVYPYTHPNFAHGTSDGRQGGFATIWLPFPMHFPDGIEVYKGTYMRDAKTGEICPYLMLTEVDKGNVTAAGGYLLYNAEQTESKMKQLVLPAPANPEDLREEEDAAFIGSTENPGQTGDATLWTEKFVNEYGDDFIPYVLADKSKDGKGIGFFRYTGATYPKGKAIYLSPKPAQGEAPAECIMFSFDDVIEAIESLHGHAITSEIYDLQGHRLNKVQKGQINVINGTKVMFK